jgi:hypothetical protein
MAQKEKLERITSGIPGVILMVKKRAERIKIPLDAIRKFYSFIKKHRLIEHKEQYLREKKETIKKILVKFVSSHSGLVGLETEANHLRTSIYESRSIETIYNQALLKKSLGPAYEGIAFEDLRLTITLTSDYPKEELIQFLKKFFDKEEIYKKLVKEELILRVDEIKLKEMIEEKQIQLLKGARNIRESSVWNVKTKMVKE